MKRSRRMLLMSTKDAESTSKPDEKAIQKETFRKVFQRQRENNIFISPSSGINMQPKAERPPVCPKAQLPQLHLTPSGGNQKRSDSISSPSGANNPWLLKPQHEIPATPPPTRSQPAFFPQRIG